jgi:hypothetical protein
MSGYPDELRGDDPRVHESARRAVQFPALLLTVTGLMTIGLAGFGATTIPDLPAGMDEAADKIDKDPQYTAEQKAKAREMADQIKELAQNGTLWAASGVVAVAGLLGAVGGVRLLSLSGPFFPAVGSVAVMLPTACVCCLLGLPAGVWSLIVLTRPDVKAVMAARRSPRPPADPDAEYMR